jgi:hypothetical protein
MTSPWRLAVSAVALVGLCVLAGCPESHSRPRPRRPATVHKRAPVVKKSPAAHHEHPHAHPHAESDHHHHPHPHPHLSGPGGHHHPY